MARSGRSCKVTTPHLDAGGLSEERREAVARYLHRALRQAFHGTWPSVRRARSMALDETLYSSIVVERPGRAPVRRQYVSVVGPRPRQRIVVPLAGVSRVSGNIRVVLDEDETRAFVHGAYEMTPLPGQASGPRTSIDWGITEVCTDDAGIKHGTGYGRVLERATEQRAKTAKARGKLRALAERAPGTRRATHIAGHNLGTKKQSHRRRRTQAALRAISGAAIKEVVYGEGNRARARGKVRRDPSQRPQLLVVEELAHLRGKARSKKISRLCASWARAENEGRMAVHAYLGSSEVETANAAYTSQTCPGPTCGYVSRDNRHKDTFHCRNPYWECNWQGDADHVAAMNLKSRVDDPEIHRYTPHREVKKILEDRFRRRLESRTGGRTASPGPSGPRDVTRMTGAQGTSVDGDATAHGRAPSKPRQRKPNVGGGDVTDSQSPVPVVGIGEAQRLESEKKTSA